MSDFKVGDIVTTNADREYSIFYFSGFFGKIVNNNANNTVNVEVLRCDKQSYIGYIVRFNPSDLLPFNLCALEKVIYNIPNL